MVNYNERTTMSDDKIQYMDYGPGLGFCLHKVRVPSCKTYLSIYCDEEGNMLDVERIVPWEMSSHAVLKTGPMWQEAAEVAKRYAKKGKVQNVQA